MNKFRNKKQAQGELEHWIRERAEKVPLLELELDMNLSLPFPSPT